MNQHTHQRAGRRSTLRNALLIGAVAATGLLSPAAAGASAVVDEPLVEPPTHFDPPTIDDDILTTPRPCELLEGCGPDEEPEDPCEGEEPPEDCPGEPGGGGEGEPGGEPEPEPEPVPEATVDPPVRATPTFTG